MIVAVSLVAAGVISCSQDWIEDFYHFPWELLQVWNDVLAYPRRFEISPRCEKKGLKMKKSLSLSFGGLSLVVWLVEMFTGWFDQALPSPIHPWCLWD